MDMTEEMYNQYNRLNSMAKGTAFSHILVSFPHGQPNAATYMKFNTTKKDAMNAMAAILTDDVSAGGAGWEVER